MSVQVLNNVGNADLWTHAVYDLLNSQWPTNIETLSLKLKDKSASALPATLVIAQSGCCSRAVQRVCCNCFGELLYSAGLAPRVLAHARLDIPTSDIIGAHILSCGKVINDAELQCQRICVLHSVVVMSDLRRQGIGGTLLRGTEAFARRLNYEWLYLSTVEAENVAFYRKYGYEEFESRALSRMMLVVTTNSQSPTSTSLKVTWFRKPLHPP